MPEPTRESRPIYCPNCGRPLRALRAPRCNWCGTPISAEDFQRIAAQSQHVMAQPDPPPLPPITSYGQRADWGFQRTPWLLTPLDWRSSRPLPPGQSRLRTAVLILVGALAATKLAYMLYAMWLLHRVIQTLPPH
ncbi:MAG: zinc ribbon domain-containing protein [Armatimonadetes bacterium]|nr:zinc ribbon domain-containing protein [Armatimonadota bacterium]